MPTSVSAADYLQKSGARVSAFLAALFDSKALPRQLFDAMNYSLLARGKRLRPVLCLAAAATFGIDEDAALPAAAALELVHCYSLIHDDLPCMDDDDLRRGQPTNHKVYGEALALLAGDALLTFAFQLLARPLPVPAERQLQMVYTLAKASGCQGMVAGQAADMQAQNTSGSLELLEFIHTHKTAALIQSAVEIGGLFADLSSSQREALRRFGMQAGLAFQIVDDLLDVIGDEAELGKAVGSDEKLQKLTYPRLVGIEETRKIAAEKLALGLHALSELSCDTSLLRGIATLILDRRR